MNKKIYLIIKTIYSEFDENHFEATHKEVSLVIWHQQEIKVVLQVNVDFEESSLDRVHDIIMYNEYQDIHSRSHSPILKEYLADTKFEDIDFEEL